MIGIAIAILWAGLVGWLLHRAMRQFAAYRGLDAGPPSHEAMPFISVVVPARDEADAIGRCLAGLRAQDYPADRFEIIVVDDGSTDETLPVARAAGQGDSRFRIIEAGGLPPGWTGKCHACWQGAAIAAGEWLCFIDADTAPQPALLRAAVTEVRARDVALLSLEPHQELVSIWERLIIPAGLFALAFVRDLRSLADKRRAEAAVNGQFILVDRARYERVGGHAAVRDVVTEDSALAAQIKATGASVILLGGVALIRARMYRTLSQLWEGLAKNVTETLGGVGTTLLVIALGPPLAWAAIGVPAWLALFSGSSAPLPLTVAAIGLSTAASLAILAVHIAGSRYFGIPLWYGALFPIGYSIAAILALHGVLDRRRGRVVWKGRIYRTRRRPRPDEAAG